MGKRMMWLRKGLLVLASVMLAGNMSVLSWAGNATGAGGSLQYAATMAYEVDEYQEINGNVVSLEIKNLPLHLNYTTRSSILVDGMILAATYENGKTQEFKDYQIYNNSDTFIIEPESAGNITGEKTVTVAYGGKTVSYTITVHDAHRNNTNTSYDTAKTMKLNQVEVGYVSTADDDMIQLESGRWNYQDYYYRLCPETTGIYEFRATGTIGVAGQLQDVNKNRLANAYTDFYDEEMVLSCELCAGQTYYFVMGPCADEWFAGDYFLTWSKEGEDAPEKPTCEQTGAHTYGAWKVTAEATALKAGCKTRTCSECGQTQTQKIDKLKASIKVSKARVTLKKGKSTVLKISGLAKGDAVKSVKSSKTSRVTVKRGKKNQYKITAKKKGKANITIILESGLKKKIKVTVK